MPPATFGQVLLTLAFLVPVAAQSAADLSRTHIFNPRWEPHARFHNALHVFHLWGLLLVQLWLVWGGAGGEAARDLRMLVAALMPVLWALPFLAGLLVPGTAFEPYPNTIPWVGPLPLNVLMSSLVPPLALLGWLADRAARGGVVDWSLAAGLLALAAAGLLLFGWWAVQKRLGGRQASAERLRAQLAAMPRG